MLKQIGRFLKKMKNLHKDEQGADLIEYILIVAAIALPLVGVLLWFKDDIKEWITEQYEEVKEEE